MAELITIARPYAKAAFEFAQESGKKSEWQEYLMFSASVVNEDSFSDYIQQPNLTHKDKLDAVVKVSNNSFPEEFKNFLAQLAENNRLSLLPAISEEYDILRTNSDKELKAVVETAYSLSPAESALIQAGLEKRFGQKVTITSEVNEELIAGVVIRVGDRVIDDSALAKLKQLKNKLTA